ncbi:protein HYPER-SENSITIVITY-RELATED 4 [Citrus sinensis]|nr:protein HYPER-SENSITIVITY-RELATED 4 [Citrus sinensis]
MQLTWELVTTENQKTSLDYDSGLYASETAHKSFHLSFSKLFKDKVLNKYLPYVAERSKAIKETKKAIKLYSLAAADAINLDHPSTFDTLAMDPVLKQALIDDLDRFVKRREFYSRVGKAWKRGYLLYGPPGTGKSSLIAAMANYLKFDIYDMELASLRSNSDLRRLLVSTGNRSIIVIEDIDCSIELENRQCGGGHDENNSQVTLSGLLNFVDGLWSSCGDERIIVFTTNYKERLDPALLRPGRMDMHIHMSYLTPSGFKILAFNYLKIKSHSMFDEIEELIKEVEVTPAEVAEELMKSEDADVALNGLVDFLLGKKEQTMKCEEPKVDEGTQGNEEENESLKNEEDCTGQKRKNVNKKKKNKKLKSFSHLLRLM